MTIDESIKHVQLRLANLNLAISMKTGAIDKAIQEFEDNAYHESLTPAISEESKAVALRALYFYRDQMEDDI